MNSVITENVVPVEGSANEQVKESEGIPVIGITDSCSTLFGIEVDTSSIDYPASNHRLSMDIRKAIKRWSDELYRCGDDSLADVAKNLQIGLNILEKRSKDRSCNRADK